MNPNRLRSLFSIFIIVLLVSGCSPDVVVVPANTALPATGEFESEIMPMTLTGAEVIWPDLAAADNCAPGLPAPSIKMCIKNENRRSASPELAHISVPAALAPGAQAAVLGSLPGGEWLPPYPVSLTGIPGVGLGTEGIIIINSSPTPDAFAAGIIIVNTIPSNSKINSVFIVIQNMPDPLSAEGIIIVNNKESEMSTIGAITMDFDIASLLPTSQPMSDSGVGLDFNQVAADITQDGFQVSAEISGLEIYPNLKNFHQMHKGIVWGGLVAGVSQDQVNSSPITQGIDWGVPPDDGIPPPDDSKSAIVWGGMPTDSAGIIIIEGLPSPGSEAEGIIIIEGKDISQVMGISMEDKPGDDAASKGIIIVNTIPAPQSSQGMSMQGIVWGGIVWGGSEATEGASQSIVIQNTPSGAISSLFGLPDGFGMPDGMMPMMGEGGFGPGAMAFGQLAFADDSFTVPAQEEKCFEILLSGLLPYLPGAGGESFPVDSFFDVFTELTVDLPEEGESSRIVSRIDPPAYPVCTPTPGPISTLIPELAPPTPTRDAPKSTPTPTVRTGLPTITPSPTPRTSRNN